MRFRLLLLSLSLLLGACSKTATPVQLDFVGITTLVSGSKTVNPNDTLSTRVYAVGNDNKLRRLRITVTYEPGPTAIEYPSPVSSFDPKNGPGALTVVYLDSLITPLFKGSNPPRGGEYLFNNSFTARSTSGTEQWQYTVTDEKMETASRAYRLTARKPDSAAVFHSYTTLLRPVPRTRRLADSLRTVRRVYLSLRTGLVLPKFAVLNQEASVQANQLLIDLIAVSSDGNSVRLTSPANPDTTVLKLNTRRWPTANRRTTELRATSLNATAFANASTLAAFTTAFANGSPFTSPLSTGVLIKNQVVAFRVTEGVDTYTGLLLVSELVLGSAPVLTCTVKVQK